jgi:gas vesicle protein
MAEYCHEAETTEEEGTEMKSGTKAIALLAGLGVGVGLGLLFAPRSGAETREWIEDTAGDGIKQLRKSGRQTLRSLRSTVTKGEKTMTSAIKSGKDALESLSEKLS